MAGEIPGGTSDSLTVQQAAEKLDAMFSDEEQDGADESLQEPTAEAEEPTQEEALSPEDDQPVDAEATEEEEGEVDPDAEPEEPEETTPKSEVHKIKVGDEELEVTTEEALKGYMRQADYTRKTQEIAAVRKELAEKEIPVLREERAQYAQLIGALKQTLETLTPKEPDWNALRAEDPERFAETWAAWDVQQKRLKAVSDEQAIAMRQVEADREAQNAALLEAEAQRLVEVLPEFGDPEKGKVVRDALISYAKSVGFTEADIAEVNDHRALVVLHKARLYDEAQKAKPALHKRVEAAKAVARPGARPGNVASFRPREVGEVTRAKQRLAKTGSVKDAASAIDLLMAQAERRKGR